MFIKKLVRHLAPAWGFVLALAIAWPAEATIFEDFQFNDSAGTTIENAANSANPGNQFDVDTDTIDVVTNGLGQLNASLKNNDEFGTNFVDTAGFTTGTLYGVMELTWDFQSVLDTAQNEEIRITLESEDPISTALAAEFRITRSDADVVTIEGRSGPGGTNTTPVTLNGGSLTQSSKFIAVVAADLTAASYEILYSSDAGGSFLSAGVGNIVPGRGVEAVRMGLNNDLVNDNILIDRVYLTDVSPVTSLDALTLEVNTVTGNIEITNDTATSFDINSYRIESPAPDQALNFGGWSSFSDNAIDAIDGPVDGDTIVGNGIGETWDEAAGSDNDVLAESFLLGSSLFAPGRSESLGSAFQVGGAETLEFQYRDAVSGAISEGTVVYVSTSLDGDYNDDGFVGQGDLDLVLLNWGDAIPPDPVPAGWVNQQPSGLIGQGALDGVLLSWGNGTASLAAVPEPATLGFVLVALSTALLGHRKCC